VALGSSLAPSDDADEIDAKVIDEVDVLLLEETDISSWSSPSSPASMLPISVDRMDYGHVLSQTLTMKNSFVSFFQNKESICFVE
jgi:hypothetical protein